MSATQKIILELKEHKEHKELAADFKNLTNMKYLVAIYEKFIVQREKLLTLCDKLETSQDKIDEAEKSYKQAITLINRKQLRSKPLAIFERDRCISEAIFDKRSISEGPDNSKEILEILQPSKLLFQEAYYLCKYCVDVKQDIDVMEEFSDGEYERVLAVHYINLVYILAELANMELNQQDAYLPLKNAVDYLHEAEKIVRSEMQKDPHFWMRVARDIWGKYYALKERICAYDILFGVVWERLFNFYYVLKDLEELLKKSSGPKESKSAAKEAESVIPAKKSQKPKKASPKRAQKPEEESSSSCFPFLNSLMKLFKGKEKPKLEQEDPIGMEVEIEIEIEKKPLLKQDPKIKSKT